MTYFADLTPYTYGHGSTDGDLNVGWLSSAHEFARGEPPLELVTSLLICAKRPVRECRGHHTCELCNDRRWVAMELDGREVKLGNGQIRVHASDGHWYAAPTLVAHYVAAHDYLPPAPFVDAVIRHAAALSTLRRPRVLTKRTRWR